MINPNMRAYNYYLYGVKDEYGQQITPNEPSGIIKMSISLYNNSTNNSILYSDCEYIGLTHAEVNDAYVIDYEGKRLKVLYVNHHKNYSQVFLQGI